MNTSERNSYRAGLAIGKPLYRTTANYSKKLENLGYLQIDKSELFHLIFV
jgi:hypothetical protein